MVLNGYTILSVFLCFIRLVLALLVVVWGLSAWRLSRKTLSPDHTSTVENRSYLLFLSSTVLIGLNVVSWPILYLLLQSYVREWPGVMCIYGVTKIGTGTIGASRFLPGLLVCLQYTKPLLVFLSGAGFVLYLNNRRTRTGSILHRVILLFLLTGGFSIVDCVVETAYLTIPKTETRLDGGCCTGSLDTLRLESQFTPQSRVTESQRPYVSSAYIFVNLAVILGLLSRMGVFGRPMTPKLHCLLYLFGLASIPVSLLFLVEIAAPAILGLPFHHCPYDLITAAPESIVAVILLLSGCFSLGWSFIAMIPGASESTDEHSRNYGLLFFALFGYSGSLLLMSLELFLANKEHLLIGGPNFFCTGAFCQTVCLTNWL